MRGDRLPAARRRRAAFTLIEMIVATILLIVGVVAALVGISSSTRAARTAEEYTTAALLAQQKMAEITVQNDQGGTSDQQGEFGGEHPGFTWRLSREATDVSGLTRVLLTIEWPGPAGRRSAPFVTYLRSKQQTP